MSIIMGPLLGFRGQEGEKWCVCALVVAEGSTTAPSLSWSTQTEQQTVSDPTLLKNFQNRNVWRFDWSVTQTDQDQQVSYTVEGDETYHFAIAGKATPLRIAYGSCNGFSSLGEMKKAKHINAMWTVLGQKHEEKPFHLLAMGGDQLYSDQIWDVVPKLKDWLDQSFEKRVASEFTAEMQAQVEAFYFNLYCDRWAQPELKKLFTQVPSLMMWDDHDIFDGWGSYAVELQKCPVFQGIYRLAREHFCLFQLKATEDALPPATLAAPPSLTYAYRIGAIAIAALDMRSERTQDQVMSPATWQALYNWIDSNLEDCKHLLVMSSIPVVYPNLNWLEALWSTFPGQQDLEDDFKDQWLSRTHQAERLRLIHRLLRYSREKSCRVTIVSGDVHVAALGCIQSARGDHPNDEAHVINQLISSGIIHTPPPGVVLYLLERVLGANVEEVDRGITAQMLKFPGTGQRFIGARNWLSLALDEDQRIWAEWYVEGETQPYTKVIHPIGY